MIDIGSTEFHINVLKLPQEQLEKFSDSLFDSWEEHIPNTVTLDDYSLVLEIEEGSVKGSGKILASLAAVYGAIAAYGSFIQGLQIIHRQIVAVGDFLTAKAVSELPNPQARASIKRKSGAIGQMRKLFHQVQKSELSVDQAMENARKFLGEEADAVPEFIERMRNSLIEVPKDGIQTSLIADDYFIEIENADNTDLPTPKRRQQRNIPDASVLRIEIIRESKKSDKRKTITIK